MGASPGSKHIVCTSCGRKTNRMPLEDTREAFAPCRFCGGIMRRMTARRDQIAERARAELAALERGERL